MLTIEEKKHRSRIANRKFYEANKESEKERTKKWRQENKPWYTKWAEKNKEKRRSNSRKCEYRLTSEEFDVKLKEQEGKCPLCLTVLENPDVDHDHSCCSQRYTCGKCTRGLLCHSCNTALGLFDESKEVLQRAIDYLKQWKERHK